MPSKEQMAQDAQFILNHPIFVQAFEAAKLETVNEIEVVDITDNQKTQELMHQLQALSRVKAKIQEFIDDMTLSEQPTLEIM